MKTTNYSERNNILAVLSKKLISFTALVLICHSGFSQWKAKASFPFGGLSQTASFSIGSKCYIVAGGPSCCYSFKGYVYDTVANSWSTITSYPGSGSDGTVGFAIGDTGYVGTGAISGNRYYKDFWKYDPSTGVGGTWTKIASLPAAAGARSYGVAFVIDGIGYVGGGLNGSNNNPLNDFYSYTPATGRWTKVADCPALGIGNQASAFVVGDTGYVGTGFNLNSGNAGVQDFWEYYPTASGGEWVQRTNFPGAARGGVAGFGTCDMGYMAFGVNSSYSTYYNDLYRFNPATNSWITLSSCPGAVRAFPSCYVVGKTLFVGEGGDWSAPSYPSDFYAYYPSFTPSFSANTNVCVGSATSFVDASNYSPTNWQWTFSGGTTTSTTSQNPTITYNTVGNYDVTLTAWNTCETGTTTQTAYISVVSGPSVTVSALPTAVCPGGSTTLSAGGAASYSWSVGGTTSSISVNPVSSTTEYVVTGTSAGCSSKDSLTVTINALPAMAVLPANPEICAGGAISLTASGAGATGNYTWKPSAGIATPSSAGTNGSPAQTTTYTVVGMNTNGCVDSTTVVLTVNQNPTVTVTPSLTVCAGASATLAATGGGTYSWSNGETSNDIAVAPLNTSSYTVTVSNGTCEAKDSTTVVVNPDPVNTVSGTGSILIGDTKPLGTNNNSAGNTYSWTNSASLSCSDCANPIATPTTTTWYALTITDASGCSKTDSVLITVKELCSPVYVPNAFSPNGDGSNDVFKVMGNCIQNMDMIVYDRWGNKVFETTNPGSGWDGTSNGRPLNTGTYVFSVQVTDLDNNIINRKGNITLLR